VLRIYRLQPGIEQFGTDIEIALIEAVKVRRAQEKRQRRPVQFMLVAQVFTCFFCIFTGAGGFNIFPHSVTAKAAEFFFQHVLRLHNQRHSNHGSLRHQVHQGIDVLPSSDFTGQMARLRRAA